MPRNILWAMRSDMLEREVSATPEEFRRSLDLAFTGLIVATGNLLCVDDGHAAMEITLATGVPRVVAAITLPTLHVTIGFSRGTLAEQAAMLARMDLAMQRGGG
jgi:hypothetical protein